MSKKTLFVLVRRDIIEVETSEEEWRSQARVPYLAVGLTAKEADDEVKNLLEACPHFLHDLEDHLDCEGRVEEEAAQVVIDLLVGEGQVSNDLRIEVATILDSMFNKLGELGMLDRKNLPR